MVKLPHDHAKIESGAELPLSTTRWELLLIALDPAGAPTPERLAALYDPLCDTLRAVELIAR